LKPDGVLARHWAFKEVLKLFPGVTVVDDWGALTVTISITAPKSRSVFAGWNFGEAQPPELSLREFSFRLEDECRERCVR
jgi:hypothetical protein